MKTWTFTLSCVLPLFYNQKLLGFTGLFRPKNYPDFSDKDEFILDIVKNYLALYLYKNIYLKQLPCCQEKNDYTHLIEQYQLTPCEGQVLKLLLAGGSNSAIVNQLSISFNTQKNIF